jgi:hypothetical protein
MLHLSRWLACCALLALSPAAIAAPADDLKSLVERGKSAEAYELGARHPELLGNPAFDFYFGVAAIDAGHAGEGVLALERYLIQFPATTVARLELARGYFVLGEDARSREEFENVAKQAPPGEVQTTLDRYLDAIRTRESRYQTTSLFYVELGGGIDSNVNGGVANANINLPVFGNVVVSNAGVRKGDSFTHLATGGQISKPLAPGVAAFAGFGVEAKLNGSERAYDMLNSAITGGISYLRDKNLFRAAASTSTLAVESDRFRTINGISGEWNHQLDELQSVQAGLQLAEFNHTGPNAVRDADYSGLSLGYRRAYPSTSWNPVLTATVNYAVEDNRRNRPDLGRDISGARVGAILSPSAKWGLNAGLGYQDSRYNGRDIILGTTRRDDYYALDFSVVYLYSKHLSIRGELLLSDNQSNLSLFSYTRNMAVLKVRYEFK